MSTALEFVHLTVKEGHEQEFVDRRVDVEQALAGLPGFVAAELVRLDDGTWLDLVHWATAEDAKAAAALFPTLTAVHPWANLIAEVKVMTHGTALRDTRE